MTPADPTVDPRAPAAAGPQAPEASGPQAPEPAPLEPDARGGPAPLEPDAPGSPAPLVGDAPGPMPEDHEGRLERDLDELTAQAEKADEYLELAQRTKADFENYRKRAIREAAAAQERGVVKLTRELLPAVDNLDRALAAADGATPVASGIKLVHAEVLAALARVGIEPFSPVGEPFDPQLHEAVAQRSVQGAEAGTVVEVYQRGYRLGESVLRPARVLVAQ
ncbi:MAG: nucleotide exchange factor GrpE [Solirubrobacterales bacterium]|nr:MAG: nucleotide exchange factor GrpE [Solirubrobacterales bacterium]